MTDIAQSSFPDATPQPVIIPDVEPVPVPENGDTGNDADTAKKDDK